jgi:hypothetical protein
VKLPWEKDPNDREANYKRPVPAAERYRIGIKAFAALAAAIAVRFWVEDRSAQGAKLTIALGATLLIAAVTDLVYMRKHDLELIFLKTPEQQRLVQKGVVVAGLALLAAGTLAYAG